jgi:hypothetical protein
MPTRTPLKLNASNQLAELESGDTIDPALLATGTRDGSKFLRDDGAWEAVGGGSGIGDVTGPASSTDNTLPRYNGTGGKTIQASGVVVDDSNAVSGVASLAVTGNITVGGTVDGRDVATDGTKLDGVAAGAEVNAASNLTATAAHGGSGVYASKSGSTLQLRPIVSGRQVQTSISTNDVVVAYDAPRYQPKREHFDRFQPRRARGPWIAGANASAPSLHGPALTNAAAVSVSGGHYVRSSGSWIIDGFSVGNVLTVSGFATGGPGGPNNGTKTVTAVSHTTLEVGGGLTTESAPGVAVMTSYTEHLYPWMVATCLDYEGYPHDRHQRLEASLSSGGLSETLGYAHGEFVAAGEFRNGAKIIFDGCGYAANTVNADAFFEFVLEPNPTVAGAPVYTGANRMRMLTGELGQTWTGNRAFRYRIELYNLGPDSYEYWGEFLVASGAGQTGIRREAGGRVTGGHNWMANDTNLQMRWRVDRIANLDTYDATYQGLTTLRLAIENYGVSAEGF